MPANKYALLRYRIIDRCLTNSGHPFPTKEELRSACEEALYGSDGEHISISTIEKDLWAMRNEGELGYYAPIEYHPTHRGYYYTEEDYSINDLTLGDEDIEAIRLAANTLYQFRGISVFNQYGSAIEKIVNRLAVSPGMEEEPAFIQFEQTPSIPGQEWFDPLVEAIRDKRVVEVTYQKFGAETAKTYSLDPFLLKEYRNRWYLIARDRNQDGERTFGLERIRGLHTTKDHYARLEAFDPDRYFNHSIGITVMDESPQNIVFRVTNRQAPYVESQPLHPSQTVVERTEEVVTFQIHVLITFELISNLLGMGDQVEVVKPSLLRNHLHTVAQNIAREHR